MPSPILVIRLGKIGDSVMTFDAISILRQRFPDSSIHVLTEDANRGIYELCGYVSCVISVPALHYVRIRFNDLVSLVKVIFRLRSNGYGKVIDLQDHSFWSEFICRVVAPFSCSPFPGQWWLTRRPQNLPDFMRANAVVPMRRAFCLIAAGSSAIEPERHSLRIRSRWQLQAETFWKDYFLISKIVVFCHLGAGSPQKVWPMERYIDLFRYFLENSSVRFVCSAGPDEPSLNSINWPKNVNLVRPCSIGYLAALMRNSQVFLGSDTGPSHLAVELNLRGVIIVQPTTRIDLWYPSPCSLDLIQKTRPDCADCDSTLKPKCKNCFEQISVQNVAKLIADSIECARRVTCSAEL